MKDGIPSTNSHNVISNHTNKVHHIMSNTRNLINRNIKSNNILELSYNKKLTDFIEITEFKDFKLNQNHDYNKSEESESNVFTIEDSDLKQILKLKKYPDKESNLINSFLKIKDEENLHEKNDNLFYYKDDEEDLIYNQLNNKLFYDKDFHPGMFTNFDINSKIRALIYNSLNSEQNINYLNYELNLSNNPINLNKI